MHTVTTGTQAVAKEEIFALCKNKNFENDYLGVSLQCMFSFWGNLDLTPRALTSLVPCTTPTVGTGQFQLELLSW